ncbi:MAG: hypothetical protein RLZZ293_1381 [Pseudomonadota bacterium]|jgi:nicotinate-nucleotide pyrophosphorylase (carboxylating)
MYTYLYDYQIHQQVSMALAEDLQFTPDWTASLIAPEQVAKAIIKTNQFMIMCGKQWLNCAFQICDPQAKIDWLVNEGDKVEAGQILCTITGQARALLSAERTALNFVQTLSATATVTHQFVEAVKPHQVQIMDTRKTIPSLRLAQKYAVRVGGGANQRVGLFDGVLIKENHILAHGSIKDVMHYALANTPKHIPIQIEVESFNELEQAVGAGAKLILLDNMNLVQIKQCVEYCQDKEVVLEVSGNVSLTNVADYAATGVQRISIGGLTKHIQAIDLSMRLS